MISRTRVEILRIPEVGRRVAFRGGTALYKRHLSPAARYAEDIHRVQVARGPIGGTCDAMRNVLGRWLGALRGVLTEVPVIRSTGFNRKTSPREHLAETTLYWDHDMRMGEITRAFRMLSICDNSWPEISYGQC